jgi:4-alpha-glucanotransferase
VDYELVGRFKLGLLARAWENFGAGRGLALRPLFEEFCAGTDWLSDYALFKAIKGAHAGADWQTWPEELVLRDPAALARARQQLRPRVGLHQFGQFLFHRQWDALKAYAHEKEVRIVGDMPIFISPDSADVWANPGLFLLDAQRRPAFVAGVPPDFFQKTGQRWGNPLYDWEAMKRDDYAWWVARLQVALGQVDLVRLDHFRGFEARWEIPAQMPTAEVGRWVKGPGVELFETLRRRLGGLPLIAEDLGVITSEVEALRDQFGLPGMRVLQFAFGGAVEERFLPHNYERNTVVYTGTHDNDTTRGWYASLKEEEAELLHRYAPETENDAAWGLIRLAWASVADHAVAPLQDVLGLGAEARMNFPGVAEGNWEWRFCARQLTDAVLDRLGSLTELYARG